MPTKKTPAYVTIPAGTVICVRTIDGIDSTQNHVGDRFQASLEEPLMVDGNVVVPKYAYVYGRLAESKESGTFTGRSELRLELTGIVVNGQDGAGRDRRIRIDRQVARGEHREENGRRSGGGIDHRRPCRWRQRRGDRRGGWRGGRSRVGNNNEGRPGEDTQRDAARFHAAAGCIGADSPELILGRDSKLVCSGQELHRLREDSVKQLRIGRGALLSAQLVLIVLFCGSGCNSTSSAQTQLATSTSNSARTPELSSEGQAWLRTAISSGSFPDLRWPDFSDYSQHVKKFYELNGDSLWWVKGMEPTPQARQVIALMLQADQKGLSADDYDGPRWNDRLARLKPATRQPTEADAVKFDLALTVCAMRYISDLHIGKVNPKHFAFAFDDESKKYDLAEFLKDHVANGGDVAGVLAQVEPPYPGYRRTIQALQTYMELAKKDDGEQLPPHKENDCTRRRLSRRPTAHATAPVGRRPSG